MKTLIVVQARMGSSRLPNKVMLPVAGAPLLQRMLERVQVAEGVQDIVVATTTLPEDDPIRRLCSNIGVECFSGHPTDLLERHCAAARAARADVVVKIPSDCPLIDPAVIERVIRSYHDLRDSVDYVSNLHPASYPDGNDVEVMPFHVLETAHNEATEEFEREHTTPFIWERPARFRIGNVQWGVGIDYSMTHRWTIDYPEDYVFIKRVYDELWSPRNPGFSLYGILALLDERPEIFELNARFAGVNWYRHHLGKLTTISDRETREPV